MEKLQRIVSLIVSITAITELVLSQLSIKIIRLSAAELTGISYFAFIIFGLVTLFAVSRMKDNILGRTFAIIINLVTSFFGIWTLQMLFSDGIFFRNLYYNLDRQTQVYELLSTGKLITASIPLALIVLGAAVYCFCAVFIFIISFVESLKALCRRKTN